VEFESVAQINCLMSLLENIILVGDSQPPRPKLTSPLLQLMKRIVYLNGRKQGLRIFLCCNHFKGIVSRWGK